MQLLAKNILVAHVNKHEAWMALTAITMKSIEYILPTMNLSEEEYRSIMSPVLRQFLPKMGINRNIKRDILYTLASIQGFNIKILT